MSDPHLAAGFTRPRRAAGILRALAWVIAVVAGVGAASVGGGEDGDTTAAVLCVAGGLFGALCAWVAAVALEWAAAMFAEVRKAKGTSDTQ